MLSDMTYAYKQVEKEINKNFNPVDDYGGWFTDGVTKIGNELKEIKTIW
jgi:hypothetical protein